MLRPMVLGVFALVVAFGSAVAADPAQDTSAAEYYRYVDAQGQVVLNRLGVPTEYISNQKGNSAFEQVSFYDEFSLISLFQIVVVAVVDGQEARTEEYQTSR